MSRYYCPFCSARHQFHITRSDGILICGQCGDLLQKKPLVNSRRIIGLVVASAFLAPLLTIFIVAIKDFAKEKIPINYESLAPSNINK